jgi:DNA-binding protein HU-beta
MNKTQLVQTVAKHADITKAQASKAVDSALETIAAALVEGEQITLIGFGTFAVRERAARAGRNPQTGKPIEIPAAKVPTFKPGKSLKDAVNT